MRPYLCVLSGSSAGACKPGEWREQVWSVVGKTEGSLSALDMLPMTRCLWVICLASEERNPRLQQVIGDHESDERSAGEKRTG